MIQRAMIEEGNEGGRRDDGHNNSSRGNSSGSVSTS